MSPKDAAAPLISVVIPTCNAAAVLGGALDSLAMQQWREFEVIVSDGACGDGCASLARQHAARLPALRVDSRPDDGVYDAINRGVALARGEWLLVLGADDRLHAGDTLAQAARVLRETSAELVHGDVRMMAAGADGVPVAGRYAGPMPLERLLKANICQQAIFYRRSLLQRLGGFDTRYRIWADWAFNLRAAFATPVLWLDLIVADYAGTGMSSRQGDAVLQQEFPELIRREFASRIGEPALKAPARHLLRQADALRRRGQWRQALRQLGTWLRVRLG